MKNKNMTIDDLVVMVQKGFHHVDEQFKQMDERFEQVDEQFGKIHHELKAIRKELLGVVYRPEFEDPQERVKDLENMLAMPSKRAG